jgi:fibronectin-binding autotransporter adhesin
MELIHLLAFGSKITMRFHRLSLRKKLALSALIAGCFATAPQAHAADYSWNQLGTASWADGANWTDITPATGVVPTATDNAIFNLTGVTGASTATLNGPQTINNITFNNTGSTNILSDSATSRTLTANGTILVATGAGGTVEIGGGSTPIQLAGTAGINITSGTLILSAATSLIGNTFTGDITVDGVNSVLAIRSGQANGQYTTQNPLGTKSGAYKLVTLTNGATFQVLSGTYNDNVFSGANIGAGQIFNIGTGGATFDVAAGANLTLDDGVAGTTAATATGAQQLQGSGALTKTGTGTLVLRQQFGFTGTINVAAGTLQMSGATGGLGAITAGTTIQSGAALNLAGQTTTEAEPLTISGTGLAATPIGAITNNSATGSAFAGPITLAAASQVGVSAAGGMTLSGAITGAFPLTINNTGTGVTALGGASTAYTGGITVKSGTLRTTTANGLGANANIITLGDTGTLSPAQPVVLDLNFGGVVAQPIVLAAGGYTGGLTIGTSNITALTNPTGGVTGTNDLLLKVTGSQNLRFSGAAIDNVGSLSNVGTGGGSTVIDSVITANVTSVTQNSSSSNLVLSAANAYTGGTNISLGTLILANTTTLPGGSLTPTQPVTVASGGTLGLGYAGAGQFTQADVTAFFAGTVPGVTFAATGTSLGLDTTAGNATYTPVIANIAGTTSSGFTKLGTNTLTLNSANTFTGPITIQNGNINTAAITNVGGGPSTLGAQTTIADATINLGGGAATGQLTYTGTATTTDRVLNMAGTTGGAIIEQSGTGLLQFTSNVTFTGIGAKTLTLGGSTAGTGEISGNIVGGIAGSPSPLTIAKTGSGTWTLSGTGNTATTLTISGGVLDTGPNGLTISNVGAATVQATGNSTINGKIILAGVGPAANGADFGATVAGVTLTVNAVIEGGLTNNVDYFSAGGTTILTGANTYSGQTQINNQIVQVGSINSVTTNGVTGAVHSAASNLGSPTTAANGTILITNNSTLRYTGTGEVTDRIISLVGTTAGGVIDQSGTGLLKFVTNFATPGAGAKTFVLTGSTAGTGEIAGVIGQNSGTFTTALTKNGTGTWTLSAANTFTGATTVNGGTLALGGTAGVALSTAVNLNVGGTLQLNNLDTANNGNRLADAAAINLAGGTLDFSNNAGAVNYSETAGALNLTGAVTSTIITDQAASGQTSILTLASLNRTAAATLNFVGTGLGLNDQNKIVITGQAAGNLPAWASYNTTGLAAYSATLGVTESAYTNIAALGGVIPNGAADNVRINSLGTSGNVTLGAATTAVNALLQNTTTASIVDTTGGTLQTTGIRINPGMQSLTIGIAPGAGVGSLTPLTAGGELLLSNNSSSPLVINSNIVDNTTASTVVISGTGATTLAGANTNLGNTIVANSTLNLTGSITGNTTTSTLVYGASVGNSIVNVSGNFTGFSTQGGSVAGAVGVYNQTAGLVTVTPGTGNSQFVAGGNGAYGYFNLTGGTYKAVNRFDVVRTVSTTATGVAYIGGTNALLDHTGSSDWFIIGYGLGQVTVGSGGTINHTGSGASFAISMDGTTSNGTLNVAGGTVITTSQPVRFGNGSATNSAGFLNLASGTLSTGTNMLNGVTGGTGNNAYINFTGGTLRSTAALTNLIPVSTGFVNFNNTVFGAIDNTAVPGAPSFAGGAIFDTNGFSTVIAAPLVSATGTGVTQTNLTVSGGTGYVGAPAVVFSTAGVVPGGTPASGYALISGGTVTGIVITNPGTYTPGTVPTITLTGGGASSAATVTSTALNTANTSGGLTKIGANTLALTNASNSYGTTTVTAGAVVGGVLGSLPGSTSPGLITVAPGAAIGGRVGVGGFSEADILTLGANASIAPGGYLGISTALGNYTYLSSIGSTWAIAKLEANTLTFDQPNTYSGGTLVAQGTLQIGNAGTTGTLGGGAVSVNTGTTLIFNRTDTYTLAPGNVVTGAGTINLVNNGTVATSVGSSFATTGALNFGAANAATTSSGLDLTNGNGSFGAVLVRTNSATPNTVTVGAGKSFDITGLTMGYDAAGGTGATLSRLTVTGPGSMNINNPAATINIGTNQAATNAAYWNDSTLDVSGLGSFSANVTNFNLGVGGTTQGPGTVLLSNTANTIIATTLTAGNTGANNGRGIGTLTFGTGTNILQADTINIGLGKNTGSGLVNFASQTTGSPGTVTISDKAGTGAAAITVGNANGTATAGGAVGTLDLRGHLATVNASTLLIGQNNMGSNTGGVTGTVSFDAGIFTVGTLNMAPRSAGGSGPANATLNVGGGTFTVNTAFTLGSQATAGTSVAALNITGGTFTSNVDIIKGAGATTATVTLNGGILNMTGKNIGSATLINNIDLQAGTLSNVNEINNGAAVSKTTAGILNYTGTNAYAGATTVAGGTLRVNGSLTNSVVTVNTGATIGGSGTITNAVNLDTGSTLAPGNSPGTLTTGNMTWTTGANYNWQGTNLSTSAPSGSNFDSLIVSGTLDIQTGFNFNLWSLSSTGPDVNGNAAGFNAAANGFWKVASATLLTGVGNLSSTVINVSAFNGTAGFSNPLLGGSFTLVTGDTTGVVGATANDVYLKFATAVVGGSPDLAVGTVTNPNLFVLQNASLATAAASVTLTNGNTDTGSVTGFTPSNAILTATTGQAISGSGPVTPNSVISLTSTATNTTAIGATVTYNTTPADGNLANNVATVNVRVGNAPLHATASSTNFGATLVAATPISVTPYTGLASNTVGQVSTGTSVPALGTTATIFNYTNSTGTDTGISMAWRSRTAAEASSTTPGDNGTLVAGYLLSDVVNLTGMGNAGGTGFTDTFILQMSYNEALLNGFESFGVAQGNIKIAWKNGTEWVNAVTGNSTSAAHYYPNQAYNASARILGDYGIDPTNNVVWAVLNHNSEFAVIPEPSTLVLGGLALLGFAGVGLRRRRIAKTQA